MRGSVSSVGRNKSTKKVTKYKNYVGIVRDHSGSMEYLASHARDDYNNLLNSLKESSKKENQETVLSVVRCGGDWGSRLNFETRLTRVESVPNTVAYYTEGNTPLFDCVGALIDEFKSTPDYEDKNVSFLIMVVTDGEENASSTWKSKLPAEIRKLQLTDRWTFTFRVPQGYKKKLVELGIHEGNIFEWEVSEEGLRHSGVVSNAATASFYSMRSSGLTSTRNFYSTDLTGVSSKTVESKLKNISSEVEFWPVSTRDKSKDIKAFCESKSGSSYVKGAAFYQLTKTEKVVQDYKVIAIRDKKKDEVYTGANARQLLGLPYNKEVKIIPGNHGQYDIFIQSTSVNRKLVPGTEVMYWSRITS